MGGEGDGAQGDRFLHFALRAPVEMTRWCFGRNDKEESSGRNDRGGCAWESVQASFLVDGLIGFVDLFELLLGLHLGFLGLGGEPVGVEAQGEALVGGLDLTVASVRVGRLRTIKICL